MRVGSRVRGEPKESNRKAAHYSIIRRKEMGRYICESGRRRVYGAIVPSV